MTTLNYIIATYSGIYRTHENKEYVLQRQLQQLYKILKAGKLSLLKQVTIVCPTPRHPAYPKYYQSRMWSYVFEREFPHVKLVYLDYHGANEDHSYDQWLQGYVAYPNFDYYLFMEDDYCFDLQQTAFDRALVDMYLRRFPENIGYLSTWASTNNN